MIGVTLISEKGKSVFSDYESGRKEGLSQLHMLYFHLLMQEDAGAFLKAFGTLGREITARTATGELRFDVRMTFEIGLKTARNILTLRNDAHARTHVFHDFGHQKGVMCATQNDGIDVGIAPHKLVNALLDEVIGTGTVGLVVLNQRHPERTCHTRYLDLGPQFADFKVVAVAFHGAFGGQKAHVVVLCERTNDLCRGANHTQNAA